MSDLIIPVTVSQSRRNITVLVLMQAFLGAQMPMLFISAGLAGQSLATNICFATLPITLIVAGSMFSATPMSAIMQRFGRRVGFSIGAAGGAIGGAICAYGLYTASFGTFLVGSLFTGVYMSSQGFFRFAAMDTASEEFRPKAISYVMAAGLASAVIGPQLSKLTTDAFVVPFMGTYLAVICINVLGAILFLFLDLPKPEVARDSVTRGRSRWELLKTPRVAVSIIAAMVAYA
ncbi:MAG: MFS transporter, partial [Paracoccaceae bacterium]